MIQQARDKALSIFRSVRTRRHNGRKTSQPRVRRTLPLRLAVENLRVFPERSVLRLTTSDGFLWLPILIPEVWRDLIGLPHAVSEIVRRGPDWYLMLAVKSEDVPTQDGPHFGLDLGVANLAVLSGPGVVRFFDGKPLRYVRGRYFRYRQALQKKRKTGMVKRSKGRESRWVRNENHRVSREIIDRVAAQGGVLHVEKLLGIRDRTKLARKVNRIVHSWPFAQLLDFIHYKAALAGVQVIEENPRYTSQQCSRCGHTERGNRTRQALFRCKACQYEIHADLNAARNLAARGASSSGVGSVTAPLSREVIDYTVDHDNCNLVSSS
jgi:IS605 OrfB family transposase